MEAGSAVYYIFGSRNMDDKPTQQEVDAVAHFVEAARELRRSPFFIEEYRTLSISMRTGDPKEKIKGHFPDTNILCAMLVPFRRLWQQSESCHYLKVANIIKKYIPNFRGFIDSILPDDKRAFVRLHPLFKDIDLSFSDVIDLWLNTRYMHVGKGSRRGRFDRSHYEQFKTEIGPVLFEYYFLASVQEAGICFFNMQQCAESFLKGFSRRGLSPTFALNTDIGDSNVDRTTPGFTPEPDTPAQRVWRLRKRKLYDGFNKFLDLIQCPDARAVHLLGHCENFDDFAAEANISLLQTDDLGSIDKDDITHFVCFRIPAFGGNAQPHMRVREVLRNALSLVVHRTEIYLCAQVSLSRRQSI
ncbi:hypothetical protein MUP42_01655, partial [Candidatus Bathyarchaeota archaeon]|nr:hypothetical protein [Candidatus Bathyarchaeota archaeon]